MCCNSRDISCSALSKPEVVISVKIGFLQNYVRRLMNTYSNVLEKGYYKGRDFFCGTETIRT